MRFVKFIENDIVDCDDGIAVSVWCGYCPHHCKGCHNEELWDFDKETPNEEVLKELIPLINKNGVKRCISFLGGEPLALPNVKDTEYLIKEIKKVYPDIKIYLWTGYTMEELQERKDVDFVFNDIDVLIEGRFILEQRDITLKLRGSPNQRIYRRVNGKLIQDK